MKAKDIMTKKIIYANNSCNINEVAYLMKKYDVGFIPITENNKIIGVITDRDLVIKVIANNDHTISSYVSKPPIILNENLAIDDVIKIMGEKQIKRVLLGSQDQVLGIISLSDIINHHSNHQNIISFIKKLNTIKSTDKEQTVDVKDFYL